MPIRPGRAVPPVDGATSPAAGRKSPPGTQRRLVSRPSSSRTVGKSDTQGMVGDTRNLHILFPSSMPCNVIAPANVDTQRGLGLSTATFAHHDEQQRLRSQPERCYAQGLTGTVPGNTLPLHRCMGVQHRVTRAAGEGSVWARQPLLTGVFPALGRACASRRAGAWDRPRDELHANLEIGSLLCTVQCLGVVGSFDEGAGF